MVRACEVIHDVYTSYVAKDFCATCTCAEKETSGLPDVEGLKSIQLIELINSSEHGQNIPFPKTKHEKSDETTKLTTFSLH